MPTFERDKLVQAIYVNGNASPHAWERQATTLMEAARIILAERLHVQSIQFDPPSDTVVMYCDDPDAIGEREDRD